jgi:hypothetical protein
MTAWHVAPDVLTRYATEPELIDDTTASSLELHLLRCDQCRATLSAASDPIELESSWDAIADHIDLPRPTPVERFLRLLGFSDSYARLVGATRALQLSWLGAMVAVIAGSVLLAQRADDPGPFLVIAPIVPLAAVALAFTPGADPAGEAGSAAPMSTVGLALRRAVAVLSVSLVAVAIGSVALPDLHLADAAWILPALGLSVGALALATWVRVEVAAVVLGGVWLTALCVAAVYAPAPVLVSNLAPLAASGQVVCAALGVGGALVLVVRRESFAMLGRTL